MEINVNCPKLNLATLKCSIMKISNKHKRETSTINTHKPTTQMVHGSGFPWHLLHLVFLFCHFSSSIILRQIQTSHDFALHSSPKKWVHFLEIPLFYSRSRHKLDSNWSFFQVPISMSHLNPKGCPILCHFLEEYQILPFKVNISFFFLYLIKKREREKTLK